jgi:hypothetical protein
MDLYFHPFVPDCVDTAGWVKRMAEIIHPAPFRSSTAVYQCSPGTCSGPEMEFHLDKIIF